MLPSKRSLIPVATVAAVLSLLAARHCAAQPNVTDLNPFDAENSKAQAINASGQIAGYYQYYDASGIHYRSVVWDSAGTPTALDPDGTFGDTYAVAINDNGLVAGTSSLGVFLWDLTGGLRTIGTPSHNGVPDTRVYVTAINGMGWVIGSGEHMDSGWSISTAWVYREGAMEAVTDSAGNDYHAHAINGSGQIAGSRRAGDYYPAVIWEKPAGATSPTITVLTQNAFAAAVAINDQGQAVVQSETGDPSLWQPTGRNPDGTLAGTLTPLNVVGTSGWYPANWRVLVMGIDATGRILGAAWNSANYNEASVWSWQNGVITDCATPGHTPAGSGELHINNQGQIAGSYMDGAQLCSFVWKAEDTALQVLPALGGTRTGVTGINDAGRIVGFAGTYYDYYERACVWTLPSNQPPVANAGLDQNVTIPHDGHPGPGYTTVTLDGSGSSDPDGDALTYEWSLYGEPQGTGVSLSLGLNQGDYTFRLTVTDTHGATSSDDVHITVSPEPNSAPVAIAGPDQTVTVLHDGNPQTHTAPVQLDGSASYDPDGDNLTYQWFEGERQIGTGTRISVDLDPGTHDITLSVTDTYGEASTDEVVVRVDAEPNSAPIANAGPDQTAVATGTSTPVTLHGSGSYDPDRDRLTYSWKEGGVQIATGASPAVSLTPGTHAITLTVTDPYFKSGEDEVVVTVWSLIISDPSATARNAKVVTVTVTTTNPSAITAYDMAVTSATLDGVSTNSPLPLLYGALKPGASKRCTLQFKTPPSGDQPLTIGGTCSLGAFSAILTVRVP